MLRAAALVAALGPCAALAQDGAGTQAWQEVPDVTSADLAQDNWAVVEAAGLDGPDGGHVVLSFWERRVAYGMAVIMRCLTTFDSSFIQVSDVCSRAEHP
jgi:hypothetical protein